MAFLVVATGVGMWVLWPSGPVPTSSTATPSPQTERAVVRSVRVEPCQLGEQDCLEATVRLTTGPDEGEDFTLDFGPPRGDDPIQKGDKIHVASNRLPATADPDPPVGVQGSGAPAYSFIDFDRRGPMLILSIAFAVIVIGAGRFHGLRALTGLGISLVIVVAFVVPALLRDGPALWIAAVGAMSVMLATIPLSHGVGAKTIAAVIGTTLALALTIGLTAFFTELANITGFSEESAFLQAQVTDLSIRGLLLAGVVIGALGVLDDVTISQASTVLALHHANPSLSSRELFVRGLGVGRDHLTATVNTLVLAYVGASLPVLLSFSIRSVDFQTAVNYEVVAAQVIATLTGSIGLIAAVPITTGVGAWLAKHLSQGELAVAAAHGHHHH